MAYSRKRSTGVQNDIGFISLAGDAIALVDAADLTRIGQYSWYVDGKGYAVRDEYRKGRRRRVRMHHEILPPVPGLVTDHKNRVKLDNRRENLRNVTRAQNQANRVLPVSRHSNARGVWKGGRSWRARIRFEGRSYDLGSFRRVEHAAEAYNQMARALLGEIAMLNVFVISTSSLRPPGEEPMAADGE